MERVLWQCGRDIIVVFVLGAVLGFALVCHCRGSLRRVHQSSADMCAHYSFAPHPHNACPSHISFFYFHGSSSKPSLLIPSHHRHQHLDISATTRGTYHPSAFTTPTPTVVVGSRCVYTSIVSLICVAKLIFVPIIRQLLIQPKNSVKLFLAF
jgi:hypothetical protein